MFAQLAFCVSSSNAAVAVVLETRNRLDRQKKEQHTDLLILNKKYQGFITFESWKIIKLFYAFVEHYSFRIDNFERLYIYLQIGNHLPVKGLPKLSCDKHNSIISH